MRSYVPSITRLCSRTILLDEGQLQADGPSSAVVTEYLRSGLGTTAERRWPDQHGRPGNEVVRLNSVRVVNSSGETSAAPRITDAIGIVMEFEVLEDGYVLVPNFELLNAEGTCVFTARDVDPDWMGIPRERGRYTTSAWIPGNLLTEGTHIVGVAVGTMNPVRVHIRERDAIAFEIIDDLDAETARGEFAGTIPGVVRPLLKWQNEFHCDRAEAVTR